MLLPSDLRDRVYENDLAKFMIEVMDRTDVSKAHVNHRGTGSAQYPPRMMLGLLIYAYACGLFSSRQIERATYESVSTRYLCGNTHPDHDTIATFRRRNMELLQSCFVTVLQLAKEMKVIQLDMLSLDGTKLNSSSSKGKNRTLAGLEQEIAGIEAKMKSCLEQAEGADQAEESGGLLLPEELSCAEKRLENLQAAKEALDERLTNEPSDRAQLQPMIDELTSSLEEIDMVLADSGYYDGLELQRLEEQAHVEILSPPTHVSKSKEVKESRYGPEHPRSRGLAFKQQMIDRLKESNNKMLYRRRAPSVEGAIGMIKATMGFDRFSTQVLSGSECGMATLRPCLQL